MRKESVLSILVCLLATANVSTADTFGTGGNQFTIDFVTISARHQSHQWLWHRQSMTTAWAPTRSPMTSGRSSRPPTVQVTGNSVDCV